MNYAGFTKNAGVSHGDFCREMLAANRQAIKPKKDAVAMKNLNRILRATLKLGNQKGFRAMSMRDLSRDSGLSMGALYDYFDGKDDLLEMIQAAGRRITGRILRDCLDQSQDPAHSLAAAIRGHIYLSEAMREWFFFSYMEARHLGDGEKQKATDSELYTERLFAQIIRKGNRQGAFAASDPNLIAALVKAMVQDWYLKRGKYAKRRVGVDRFANRVVEAALLMCRAGEPSRSGKRSSGR